MGALRQGALMDTRMVCSMAHPAISRCGVQCRAEQSCPLVLVIIGMHPHSRLSHANSSVQWSAGGCHASPSMEAVDLAQAFDTIATAGQSAVQAERRFSTQP